MKITHSDIVLGEEIRPNFFNGSHQDKPVLVQVHDNVTMDEATVSKLIDKKCDHFNGCRAVQLYPFPDYAFNSETKTLFVVSQPIPAGFKPLRFWCEHHKDKGYAWQTFIYNKLVRAFDCWHRNDEWHGNLHLDCIYMDSVSHEIIMAEPYPFHVPVIKSDTIYPTFTRKRRRAANTTTSTAAPATVPVPAAPSGGDSSSSKQSDEEAAAAKAKKVEIKLKRKQRELAKIKHLKVDVNFVSNWNYAAPELFAIDHQKRPNPRAIRDGPALDSYSFGLIVYYICTGKELITSKGTNNFKNCHIMNAKTHSKKAAVIVREESLQKNLRYYGVHNFTKHFIDCIRGCLQFNNQTRSKFDIETITESQTYEINKIDEIKSIEHKKKPKSDDSDEQEIPASILESLPSAPKHFKFMVADTTSSSHELVVASKPLISPQNDIVAESFQDFMLAKPLEKFLYVII